MSRNLKQVIADEIKALQAELYPQLKGASLHWQTVDLGFRATVEVCVPASITVNNAILAKYIHLGVIQATGTSPPLYLPVTKLQTWEMAPQHRAFPLTTKVSDSVYKDKGVTVVPFHMGKFAAGEESDNFIKYADYLAANGASPTKLFSGAIKLWILSNVKSQKTPNCPGAE